MKPSSDQIPVREMLQAAGFAGPIGQIEDISTGMLNAVYKVTLKDRDVPLILRVRTFQHPEYGQEFAAERFAYHLIDGTKIQVPRLHYVCPDSAAFGYPFAVFDFVKGRTFDRVLEDKHAPKQKKHRLLESLGASLSDLHRVKGPGYGTLTSIWFSREQRRNFWRKLFKAEQERLLKVDAHAGTHYERALEGWLDKFDALPPSLGEPRLVHGDIHGRNVIATDDNRACLLDWEASRFRIAPYDFAQIRYLNLRKDPEGWDILLSSYIAASPDKIDKPQLQQSIDICQSFWQLRMGLFQRQFPFGESDYFGNARTHIAQVQRFIGMPHQRVKNQIRTLENST